MVDQIPFYVTAIFLASTLYTFLIISWCIKGSDSSRTGNRSTYIILGLLVWIIIQGIISKNNYYLDYTDSMPPKIFLYGVFPNILLILGLFFIPAGKTFIDELPLENLTYIHIVRIPIELVLY